VEKIILAVTLATVGTSALAGGGWVMRTNSVPVDSPIALLGLAVAVSLVVARVLKNRQK
jgi:hypothetical protein